MHILLPETDNCPSWISGRERMTVENISWSISTKECCRPRLGVNPQPPGLQSDGASNWATEAQNAPNDDSDQTGECLGGSESSLGTHVERYVNLGCGSYVNNKGSDQSVYSLRLIRALSVCPYKLFTDSVRGKHMTLLSMYTTVSNRGVADDKLA